MKKLIIAAAIALLAAPLSRAEYRPAGDKIKTRWAQKVDPQNPRPEYPRPLLRRDEWKNLNGLWQYAITPAGQAMPEKMDGDILVPFAVESSLSGVARNVGADNELWYSRTFTVPSAWNGRKVMLNFGAVDWKCDIWVNGIKVGSHTGGYTPFSIDITRALAPAGTDNTLVARVWDPTDSGPQPRGKQVSDPKGIWYTPVTGIWQTVWLEPVGEAHITDVRITPDIDRNTLSVDVASTAADPLVKVTVSDAEGNTVAQASAINGTAAEIKMPGGTRLWSPADPYLYSVAVELFDGGTKTDEARSYAAMRKFSTAKDHNGIVRLQLNNRNIFQFGPLDQGWWPDGLYTAPTHEAMVFDIDKTKELGFNMIRKHIKIEPATWYAHCDSAGIIVWQDMPSGDFNGHRGRVEPEWQNRRYFDGAEFTRTPQSEETYRKEWKEIIDCLYSHPCIATWIPFNEGWGQFKTAEIARWTKEYDPTRLCNPASGGNFYPCGDILDLHNYPGPEMYLFDAGRANVLGEYGGIGYVVKKHIWFPDRNWGYIQFNTPREVTDEYVKYARQILDLVGRGFTGAVYTQTTDVEGEVNGFMTYDREVMKTEENRVAEINRKLSSCLDDTK